MSGLPARRRVEERRAAAEVAIPEEDATAEEDAGLEPEGSSAGGGGTGEYDADAWKAFGRDTEAGRLLSKLYGGGPKPKISYPKPRVMPRRAEDTRAFVPAGGKADTDYRVDKRKDTSGLVVPRVGGHDMPSFAPIELRAGQGVVPKSEIDRRREEDERTADTVFPPLTKPVYTEAEKRKLQALFQFKGGKALPEELTLAPIEGHVPLSVVAPQRKGSGRRRPAAAAPAAPASAGSMQDVLHAMVLEVAGEIDSRQEHLEEMRRLGMSRDAEAAIVGEISQRVAELERLNRQLDRVQGRASP